MSDRHVKLQGALPGKVQEDQLSVADIVQYLSGLAKLHEGDRIGSTELSRGLRYFANALQPYMDYAVSDLSAALKSGNVSTRSARPAKGRSKLPLPDQLESIGQQDIQRILDSDSYTKRHIVELGAQRFGISRSKLDRLRKKDALDAVRAALEHERSLDAISEEASRVGNDIQLRSPSRIKPVAVDSPG